MAIVVEQPVNRWRPLAIAEIRIASLLLPAAAVTWFISLAL